MAYDATKLTLMANGQAAGAPRLWFLDTVDTGATVNTDAYISDGASRGMGVGDLVMCVHRTSSSNSLPADFRQYIVLSVGATSVDLSDGSQIGVGDAD